MCWSALPDHINSPEEWFGKDDDDHWWTRWRKKVKGMFAYGPRDKHSWHRWRIAPITLFAIFGYGESRWENNFMHLRSTNEPIFFYRPPKDGFYLSRVQYWTDWHIQLAWPLFFSCHIRLKRVVWQFYVGAKVDADRVVWFPAIFLGKGWK